MIDNIPTLADVLSSGAIRANDCPLFHEPPPRLDGVEFERVEGMLLGLAVGDALGATTESQNPNDRLRKYGEIRDYVPGKRSGFEQAGAATDDTQFSFWTIEQLLEDGGLVPDNLARKFCTHRVVGIGNTTKEFIRNYKDRHVPWYQAGVDSLGNGAIMRIAPVVLPYLRTPHPSVYADAALNTMITHNSFANIATCVAFVKMLWSLMSMKSAPRAQWWIDEYCTAANQLEGDTRYRPRYPSRSQYEGPLWVFAREACYAALDKGFTAREACDSWGSGASLFETVPSVLYILTKHGQDPEEAIVRAVNDTKDNDTIAAIVGAAVGALHGIGAIPQRWLRQLSGNIRVGGSRYQVFRLTLLAKRAFWLDERAHSV